MVFDVSQQGSALKVITLRSALSVSNQLNGPIDLRMENPIIPGILYIDILLIQQVFCQFVYLLVQ